MAVEWRLCLRFRVGLRRAAAVQLRTAAFVLLAFGVLTGCNGGAPTPSSFPSAAGSSSIPGQSGQGENQLARDLKITAPPAVSVIREISPQESQEVWTACLRDAGWPESGPDEGILIPPGQEDSFNVAYYTCHQQYPVEGRFTEPLTAEQLGVLYDWWIDHTVPCFESRGWDVGDIPTREVFLADPEWLPAERIAEQAGPDVEAGRVASMDEALYGVCPGPPDDVLYGD